MIEKNYGAGNGDYEVFEDLYEIAPERTPVNKEAAEALTKLVDSLVFLIDALYKDKPF